MCDRTSVAGLGDLAEMQMKCVNYGIVVHRLELARWGSSLLLNRARRLRFIEYVVQPLFQSLDSGQRPTYAEPGDEEHGDRLTEEEMPLTAGVV